MSKRWSLPGSIIFGDEFKLKFTRAIIAGNIYGIPFSAFLSRLQGIPYPVSSLPYEIGMLAGGLILLY